MKKPLQTVLYSTLGVAAVFLILVAANYLAGRVPRRIDLTQEKAYTLSAGTRAILAKLDTPVQIRFYCTRDENMPPQLKLYAQQVEDLLNEYRQASNGHIEIQKLNPEPDSEAEDSARLDGVEGQPLQNGEDLYLGLSVSMLDSKEALPFLTPDRERLLEYDLSRAISRVTAVEKPVVGLLSPLPVAGQPANPMMMMQMPQQSAQQPWVLLTELKRDFTVKEVPFTADKIPDEIKVLMVIHPRGISDATQYALDQFVLRGGKLIAYLDPSAILDRPAGNQAMFAPPSGGSNLDKLLKAWGVTFDDTKVVADMEYLGRTGRGRAPGVLALSEGALSKDDVVTTGAGNLFMIFAGAFGGTPAEGLKETVLIKSSPTAELVDPMMAQTSPESILKSFRPADKEFPLAIRLTGKFKTAFPDGKPKEASADEGKKAESKDDKAKDGKNGKAQPPAPEPGLKESAQENTVVLIGDCDMIQDAAAVIEQQNPFTGGRMLLPANGNLGFAQAAVEQLTGDDNLIAVRSRASRERPFTVVQKMEAQANAAYQNKIGELEASLSETQRKLAALQQNKEGSGGQRFILSAEQQSELEKFRKTEADVKKQLKEVRRTLRADTDALKNRVKWINIALMPAVIAVSGLALAAYKRKQTAAK